MLVNSDDGLKYMTDKRIRILMFCPTDTTGGVGHLVKDICDIINKDIFLVDFMYYDSPNEKWLEWIKTNGWNFFLIPKYSRQPIKFLKQIFLFFKKNKYDILHYHASTATVIMYSLPKWFDKKQMCFFHSHNNSADIKTLHYVMRSIVTKRMNCLLTVSEQAAKWMYGRKYKEAYILKNGIKTKDFLFNHMARTETRQMLNIEDKFVLGHIGRFEEQKNHDFLIDIFFEVKKLNEDAVLLLIGAGSLEKKIQNKVKEYKLTESVLFCGTTNNVSPYMQAMDVFVLPSKWEGLGIVAIEAQAADLPVVASTEVPVEAHLSTKFDSLSLNVAPRIWADSILKYYRNNINRCNQELLIEQNGYDIELVVKQLESLYISKE